jgi:hypothetical protein
VDRRGARNDAPRKAKTLILTGTKNLLNPEFEPQAAAKAIKNVRVVTISPGRVSGHASAGAGFPADVEFLNRETASFLDSVKACGGAPVVGVRSYQQTRKKPGIAAGMCIDVARPA